MHVNVQLLPQSICQKKNLFFREIEFLKKKNRETYRSTFLKNGKS